MDGEGIVWLIAVGWVILSWIMKAIKGATRQPGGSTSTIDTKPDAHDLREARARLRAERARQKRLQGASPRDTALSDFKRELERVMGVHVEEEHGPAGRRSTIRLESAEEVEERDSLEEEPQVVSLETAGDRGVRDDVNEEDKQLSELLLRRQAVADAHARPLTRADHQRFDRSIRAPAAAPQPAKPRTGRPSMRQAFIWSEVLGKPISER